MSYAAEHPVHCARREDLGCPASHPGGRWGAMKADREGWFHSKAEECAYCPEHVPGWVPAWRARQEAKLHKVTRSVAVLPVTVRCSGCALRRTGDDKDPEAEAELRELAWQHARKTGHRITMTVTRETTLEPADD